jgi:mannan polymerase II complex MNN10 subunit
MHQSLRNKWHYSRKHGYDLVVDYEERSQRGNMWLKFDMMERLIIAGKHDWIWWIDFDTLFTNSDIKVTDLITSTLANSTSNPADIDFILAKDW